MNKILLWVLLGCSPLLVGCGEKHKDTTATVKVVESAFIYKKHTDVNGYGYKIFQHKVSGNCYAQVGQWVLSQVSCLDFGVKSVEELAQEELNKEKEDYLKLKKKFGEG